MAARRDNVRDRVVEILTEGGNTPMYIDEIRRELERCLNPARLPNHSSLSRILSNSDDFLIEGAPRERTYRLKPDVYEKLKREPEGS